MRKIITYGVVIMLLLFVSGSNVGASETSNVKNDYNDIHQSVAMQNENIKETIENYYVAAQVVKVNFSIQSGKAICTCRITPKTKTSITSIKGNFKIINSAGKTVKTYDQMMEKSNNIFCFSENYKLPAKGTYYMKATMTCYKNGVKKETITKISAKKSY